MTDNLHLSHHISIVYYNVQSISSKLDTFYSKLLDFDMLAFSEIRLSPDIPTEDLLLDYFIKPERKDRLADSHGAVIVMSKRDYTSSTGTILNLTEQNVFGLNLLTILSMYYIGYFTYLLFLTLHMFPQ